MAVVSCLRCTYTLAEPGPEERVWIPHLPADSDFGPWRVGLLSGDVRYVPLFSCLLAAGVSPKRLRHVSEDQGAPWWQAGRRGGLREFCTTLCFSSTGQGTLALTYKG